MGVHSCGVAVRQGKTEGERKQENLLGTHNASAHADWEKWALPCSMDTALEQGQTPTPIITPAVFPLLHSLVVLTAAL